VAGREEVVKDLLGHLPLRLAWIELNLPREKAKLCHFPGLFQPSFLMIPGLSTESSFLACSPRWFGIARRGDGVWQEQRGSHYCSKFPPVMSVPNTGQGWRGPELLHVPQPRPDLHRNGKPLTLRG